MEHFSEQAWAEFGRGFSASEKAQGITAHLAANCLNCKANSRFWNRLQTMAQSEHEYSAPENLVRLAKLEFTAKKEFRPKNGAWPASCSTACPSLYWRECAAALPSPGRWCTRRKDFTVDLRFDLVVPSGMVSAVGQILDSHMTHEPLTGAPVVVWNQNGQLVATATANAYGEFQLEFEARDDLRLTARVGDRRVRMPLVNLK